MKIGLNTDGFGALTLEACLDRVAELGLDAVEFALGGWSTGPHVKVDDMLTNAAARDRLSGMLRDRRLHISALNCSGNPLHPGSSGAADAALTLKTIELARVLGVTRIVMMSGLPAGPGDQHPNWITSSWPPETVQILDWQWRERILPYWRDLAQVADRSGVRVCIEQHGRQAVYNNESFFRLREAIGPTVGVNFDPSHLMWMGGDPVSAIEKLGGDCIYHVHGKDTRIEPQARIDGLLDLKPPQPVRGRSWNYVSLGHGNPVRAWLDIVRALGAVGYDGVISIENEDYLVDADTAISTSASVLKFCLKELEAERGVRV